MNQKQTRAYLKDVRIIKCARCGVSTPCKSSNRKFCGPCTIDIGVEKSRLRYLKTKNDNNVQSLPKKIQRNSRSRKTFKRSKKN